MPAASNRTDQIKELLVHTYHNHGSNAQDSNAGKSRSSTTIHRAKTTSKAAEDVERRIRYLKHVRRGYPTLNDASPDPGCGYEAARYTQLLGSDRHSEAAHGEEIRVGQNTRPACLATLALPTISALCASM